MISDHEGGTIIWENIKDKEKNGKVLLFLVDLKELVKFSVVPHTHTHTHEHMHACTAQPNHPVVSIKTGS